MKYYVMYAETAVEEYFIPADTLKDELMEGCLYSEFQYLDHKPLESEISEDGGMEFPDFITAGYVPFISDRFKRLLDDLQVDNLFYKPIAFTFSPLGIKEYYYLALPPRINCLNWDESGVQTEENEFLAPTELMREAEDIVINEYAVGNYKIFKLANVTNQEIIVTEEIKNAIETANLENVYFAELKGENNGNS